MRILTNKEEIINQFEYFIDEILNKKDMKISDLTKNIKVKMLNLGAKIFEKWLEENIGTEVVPF
jgi:predicted nucleotide-binding protein (sugar kinase/HSP70/actin superfamily)